MENLHVKNIRKWVLLLAIFTGFSIQTGFSNDLVSIKDLSVATQAGADSVTFTFGCINGAAAMEQSFTTGSITPLKSANLILTKPGTTIDFLPYSFGQSWIDRVIINGQVF